MKASTAWLLLVIWSDLGLTKNGGEYETLAECKQAWADSVACWQDELKSTKKDKLKTWGTPTGFCVQAERLTAPGIIYPVEPDDKKPAVCP
jgi:hypothetical protein